MKWLCEAPYYCVGEGEGMGIAVPAMLGTREQLAALLP